MFWLIAGSLEFKNRFTRALDYPWPGLPMPGPTHASISSQLPSGAVMWSPSRAMLLIVRSILQHRVPKNATRSGKSGWGNTQLSAQTFTPPSQPKPIPLHAASRTHSFSCHAQSRPHPARCGFTSSCTEFTTRLRCHLSLSETSWPSQAGRARQAEPGRPSQAGEARLEETNWPSQTGRARQAETGRR